MRVLSVTELPAVIRVETPQGVIVALPAVESPDEILRLASLILSAKEFEELRKTLRHQGGDPGAGGKRPVNRP